MIMDSPAETANTKGSMEKKKEALQKAGVEILPVPAADDGHIDLNHLMKELGARKIDGILLEGGGILNESALRAGIVKRAYCFIAPKIFGGREAKTPVEGRGQALAADAWLFEQIGMQSFGEDLMVEYRTR